MKNKIISIFLAIMACVAFANAEKVQIGDLYYNLDATNQTAEVSEDSGVLHVIDLDLTQSMSIEDWTVIDAAPNMGATDETIGRYVFDVYAGVPGIAYLTEEPNVQFITSTYSLDKQKIIYIQTGQYFMFGGKNGVIKIMNTAPEDRIILTVAAKGGTPANLSDPAGVYPKNAVAISDDLMLPPKDISSPEADENGYIWREIEYISTGGDVEIKEFSAGFCVKKVVVERQEIIPEDNPISGTCGDNLTWTLIDSVLTISGTGEMDSMQHISWRDYKNVVKSVIINEGATSIGYGAFVEFTGLTSITIPNSVTSIGYSALNYCTGLTSVTIPNSVTSIGDYAFAYSGITSVTIPNSVTSIGLLAFFDCGSLSSINVDEENPNYSSVEGVLYNKNKTTLIQCPKGWQGECVIPSSVTSIEIFAFYNCTGLTSVTIPNSVTSIGSAVFYDCAGLTSITCEVVVPPALESDVFYGVDKSIPLYVPAESIEAYKAANRWKDFSNIQPIGLPVIFLDYNSTVLSNQYVKYGMSAQAPEVPAREGYTFVGWNVDIKHIIAPTYAIALYEKIGGTVTYLSEEGDVIASENVDLHLPAAPIIAGKSFKGWLTESADADGIVLRATYTSDNPTTNDNVTVTPTSNSADVSFPFITGALTYELVIRDQDGNVVCKIMFNSSGQLLGIAFAPSRNRNQQQATQSIGFNFIVEGLNANTTYSYEFVAYDETDEVIETLSGSFTTTDETPTNIDNTPASNTPQKYIQDGHLFIDNNNRTFDARGQQVK